MQQAAYEGLIARQCPLPFCRSFPMLLRSCFSWKRRFRLREQHRRVMFRQQEADEQTGWELMLLSSNVLHFCSVPSKDVARLFPSDSQLLLYAPGGSQQYKENHLSEGKLEASRTMYAWTVLASSSTHAGPLLTSH